MHVIRMNFRDVTILFLVLMFFTSFFSTGITAEETCSVDDESCETKSEDDNIILFSASDAEDIVDEMWEQHEEGQICVIYFYSEYCSHCQSLKPFIDNIEEKYPEVALTKLNIDEMTNFEIYNYFCQERQYKGKEIPLVAIGNNYFVGETDIKNNLEAKIDQMLDSDERVCPLAGVMSCHSDLNDSQPYVPGIGDEGELVWYKTVPAIVVSGLVDGVNPCAFAVLIFMMTILLEISGSKKRVFKIGLSYIIAFVLANITLGVIVYWFSDLVFKGSSIPLKFAAGIAIVAGIINIKDYFAYGKGFSLQIPKGTKKIIQKWINYASIPAAIVLGVILAILEAPCSASIYYAILEMLRNKTALLGQAMPYIILYNIMFILPLVFLFIIIYAGKKTGALERWRNSNKKMMKLVSGLVFLGLGLAIILGLI